jgi:tetratricopeptide (TPR) repeat protein
MDARGVRLWGKSFDRVSGDVLAVQNEIAIAILTEGLGLTLSEAQHRRLSGALTGDAKAYELFLQAIHHIRLDTEDGYLAARALLMQTVQRDPNFALALVTLASTYSAMAINGYAPASESWPAADRFVRAAMGIAPDLPEVHAELASQAFFGRRDAVASERQWKVALESPHGGLQTELLATYALQKWASGDPERALAIATMARQMDPLSAQASVLEADLLAHLGRLNEASIIYERLVKALPDDLRALLGLAELRRKQGRFDDAIAARRQAHAQAGDHSLDSVFATVRGAAGYDQLVRAAAEQELAHLMDRAIDGDYVSELDLARTYAQLANADETFAHLSAAIDEQAPGLMFLLVDPAWDNVRRDARFGAAVHRLGIGS